MSQAVIFKDYETDTELEVADEDDFVEIQAYVYGHGAGATIKLSPPLARELARVLNVFASVAEGNRAEEAQSEKFFEEEL